MLDELRVENLVLIEEARLGLGPGLNVLTGETGAGKTMLAHALDLLLGGRARSGLVRPGAAEAYVEGVFTLDDARRERLGERLAADASELVLARRVGADGRSRAYLNGRSATVGELREVAGELLSFYGQHEHRRLTLAAHQRDILDELAGAQQRARRQRCARAHAELAKLEARRDELHVRAGARERELDLLAYELSEIEAAAPSVAEEGELTAERDCLRHLEVLREACAAGARSLDGEGTTEAVGAAGALASAARALDGAAGIDPALDALIERHRALLYEARDLAGDLRRHQESIDAPPGRLAEVEERLEVVGRLARKHGGDVAAVLEHAQRCRSRREELLDADVALRDADERHATAHAELERAAGELSTARAAAAPRLAEAVQERLGELAMPGARFQAVLEPRAAPGGAGAERVEFLIAANPGVPAAPLREIASGGELSRVMLALLSVAAERAGGEAGGDETDDAPLLVFDEVDAGIGGHTAVAVAARLRALASRRQVLCITHLPQVASRADRHFVISKDEHARPVRTRVRGLDGEGVVGELVRMLGATEDDAAAREHARELLRAA